MASKTYTQDDALEDTIKCAPVGSEGERIIHLADLGGMLRKMAEARLRAWGEYTCRYRGIRVRVLP